MSKLLLVSLLVLPLLASANESMTPMQEYTDPPFVNEEIMVMEDRFPGVTYPQGFILDNAVPWKTDVAEFNPYGEFDVATREAVIADEVELTGAERPLITRRSGSSSMGVEEELIIDQGKSSESSVPPQQIIADIYSVEDVLDLRREQPEMCPVTQSYIFNETFNKTERYGNNTFGAQYEIDTYLRASNVTGGKKYEARAEGNVRATAFGWTFTIAKAYAQVESAPTVANAQAEIYVMGTSLWSTSHSSSISYTKSFSRHFFRSQKVFMVGPVPIRVTASLNGRAELAVTASTNVLGQVGVALTATPGIYADANVTAGADVLVFATGFSGDVRLIGVSFPVKKSITASLSNGFNWQFKVDRTISTLQGSVSVYAVVRFIFFRQRWTVTVFSWPGYNFNGNLTTRGNMSRTVSRTVSLPVP